MFKLPVHTPRTTIRLPVRTDMRSWCALDRSKLVRQFLNGPLCRQADEQWKLMQLTFRQKPISQFAIIANDSNDFIGQCGFLCSTAAPNDVEFCCALRRKYWREGFAGEISTAMLTEAFSTLKVGRVTGIVDPDNQASIELVTRLGFRHKGNYDADDWKRGHFIFRLSAQIMKPDRPCA